MRLVSGMRPIFPTLATSLLSSLHAEIVINEIHYDPFPKVERVEFVELYNSGAETVDLGGWTFTNGFDYTFPADSELEAGAFLVLAQNRKDYDNKFGSIFVGGVKAFDEFAGGSLNNRSETIVLADGQGLEVDRVDYKLGFPWPTTPGGEGVSLELVHPDLDNSLGGSWRPSEEPTPGEENSVFSETHPPQIRKVSHSDPMPGEDVTVTAKATDPDGVKSVVLHYQVVEPGDYIELEDERFETEWTETPMTPTAEADVYEGTIPGEHQAHRQLVRYRIVATDDNDLGGRAPLEDDPQPNFAYYVYDTMPDWKGAVEPGEDEPVTYPAETLSRVPVYQLITTRQSHLDSQSIPGAERGSYGGSDYLWSGTLVYGDDVYDHIRYRARGGVWRYAMGKNMWKFAFNRGHRFQAYDNYGNKYPEKWRRLNFSAIIQQGNFQHRGEQGLFESVGFELFEKAGVEAPDTHYIHFRIVEKKGESSLFGNQYGLDFQGLYLVIEQPDGRFLESHDLPDGNIYKMENGTGIKGLDGELKNIGGYPLPDDYGDLEEFKNTYEGGRQEESWWEANLDLERYYGYRSILEAIHHYDIHAGKNYYYYHNGDNNKWHVIPWDLDLTWDDGMYGTGNEPFNSRVLQIERFEREYHNRMLEIRDLLYNEEQCGMLIDEKAAIVWSADEPSLIDADRAMWDYNPIMTSNKVNPSKSGEGRFYQIAGSKDFAGMIERMKNYVRNRGEWIDDTILPGETKTPKPPTVQYVGASGFPVDDLRFSCSKFSGGTIFAPQEFGAMKWRIAEVTDPSAEDFDPRGRHRYEIDADWESEVITEYTPEVLIPVNAVRPDRLYRVRARMMNDAGYWGSWSEPIQFVTTAPDLSNYKAGLVITEIMYHPAEATAEEVAAGYETENFEYVELANVGSVPLDLKDIRFTKGIDYDFENAAATTLAPGAVVVLAHNQAAFAARYGDTATVVGEYGAEDGSNRLANDGENLKLSYGGGIAIRELRYDDAEPWPVGADGEGASLELVNAAAVPDHGAAASWTASQVGGTPGVLPDPVESLSYVAWLELHFTPAEIQAGELTGVAADADGDGEPNAVEYAAGIEPRIGKPESIEVERLANGEIAFRFRMASVVTQAAVTAEASTDLQSWSSIVGFDRAEGDGWITWTGPAASEETYLRVSVTVPVAE